MVDPAHPAAGPGTGLTVAGPGTALVRLEDVCKTYGSGATARTVFSGASLAIREGELAAVVGPSGCGKTTLLNLVGALDRATSGAVWLAGVDLTTLPARELAEVRRSTVGFVFQLHNLISGLTALENVELGLEAAGRRGRGVRERARHWLDRVGLRDASHRFAEQLSGGEQQRVAIARALAKEPRLVLADEPTGNLDEETAGRVAAVLRDLQRELGTTLVVVTHNQGLARVADRVHAIARGRIVEAGPAPGPDETTSGPLARGR